MSALVWFRNDLRVDDNTALYNASLRHRDIGAVFVLTPGQWEEHDWGARKQHFVWNNLVCLRDALAGIGIALRVSLAPDFRAAAQQVAELAHREGAECVYANAEYGVDELARDRLAAAKLGEVGIGWRVFDDLSLLPPGRVLTRQGEAFRVFSPFRRAWLDQVRGESIPCLAAPAAAAPAPSPPLPDWRPPLGVRIDGGWPAGEPAARRRLHDFIEHRIRRYDTQRDIPALDGTSRLSPYLAVGVISARRCFEAALAANEGEWDSGNSGIQTWLTELIWREFYIHVLAAFPRVSRNRAFRPETDALAWRGAGSDFVAWCRGDTGYPLVDAAMHQLLETGWMHNRLRMVSAMFLSKYLLVDWRHGERFFMQQLVDGDLSANNGGWQWSASSGTDAAPYFRLLSPVRQAERFDPDGEFIRRYLPALADVPTKALMRPGSPELLSRGYPAPIVDLKFGRERALQAFRALGPAR